MVTFHSLQLRYMSSNVLVLFSVLYGWLSWFQACLLGTEEALPCIKQHTAFQRVCEGTISHIRFFICKDLVL